MKFLVVFALCIAAVAARSYGGYSQDSTPFKMDSFKTDSGFVSVKSSSLSGTTPVPILKQELVDDHKGTYHLEVQTGDGQSQRESAQLKNLGRKEGPDVVKEGEYSYTSPDGRTITVHWRSDENGFQAKGDHLPTAPPVPEEIRKVVEAANANARKQDFTQEAFIMNRAQYYGSY